MEEEVEALFFFLAVDVKEERSRPALKEMVMEDEPDPGHGRWTATTMTTAPLSIHSPSVIH